MQLPTQQADVPKRQKLVLYMTRAELSATIQGAVFAAVLAVTLLFGMVAACASVLMR